MKITDKLNITTGFSAHVDFEDLENIGWDFTQLYEGVAAAQQMTLKQAENWEKENYHVRLYNNGQGVYWIPSHNNHGDTGDSEWPGDEAQTEKDIEELYERGLLWEVENGEDENNSDN